MAATYALAVGTDRTRTKETHRVGSQSALGEARTWHTTATAFVRADGSGYVEVYRDGKRLHGFTFDAEDADRARDLVSAAAEASEHYSEDELELYAEHRRGEHHDAVVVDCAECRAAEAPFEGYRVPRTGR